MRNLFLLIVLIYSNILFGQESKFHSFYVPDYKKMAPYLPPNDFAPAKQLPNNFEIIEIKPEPYDSSKFSREEYIRLANILGNYTVFKWNFLEIRLNNEVPDIGLPKARPGIPQLLDDKYLSSPLFAIFNPIDFFYFNFNRHEISKRKAYRLEAYAPIQRKIDAKYNRQNIEKWTGLKNDKLTKFVLFCNFDNNFLSQVNEYDLMVTINQKLQEFISLSDSCNEKY